LMTQLSSDNKGGNKARPAKGLLISIVIIVLLLDQYVKYVIRTNFAVGESVPVIENIFHITYVQNTGAAFSMFENMPVMTIIVPVILMIICAVAIYKLYKENLVFPLVCVELVLSGGIGNLIDRLGRGYVVDMIDFRVFPVFNVADIAVTCGCGLLIIWLLFTKQGRAFMSEDATEK